MSRLCWQTGEGGAALLRISRCPQMTIFNPASAFLSWWVGIWFQNSDGAHTPYGLLFCLLFLLSGDYGHIWSTRTCVHIMLSLSERDFKEHWRSVTCLAAKYICSCCRTLREAFVLQRLCLPVSCCCYYHVLRHYPLKMSRQIIQTKTYNEENKMIINVTRVSNSFFYFERVSTQFLKCAKMKKCIMFFFLQWRK